MNTIQTAKMASIIKSDVMNAGDGHLSYAKNSSYQRKGMYDAKAIIEEEIATKLEIPSSQTCFCIADFGCSTGHNSFPAMQIIIEAIKQKHKHSYEFHVFFNDVVSNDFNTLFSSLPPYRDYSVAAVPGSFHGRLLPLSSLHFAYSCWSLHWLSEVPKAVADRSSPAWNRGEIFYTRGRKEVCDAYLDQFEKDLESFLKCREVEMVDGGLMALLLPGVPAIWDREKEYTVASLSEPLRSSLLDMAKEGKVSEAEIDSFNIPHYIPTPQQLKAILERSYNFSLERMEILNNIGKSLFLDISGGIAAVRAVYERLLTRHFGEGIIDELFHLYEKKITASPIFNNPNNDKGVLILVVLQRKIV